MSMRVAVDAENIKKKHEISGISAFIEMSRLNMVVFHRISKYLLESELIHIAL